MSTKQMLNEKGIAECTDRLAERILSENPKPENLVLVGVITRGSTLAKRLREIIVNRSSADVLAGSLDTRPHRDDLKAKANVDLTDIPFKITGKDVILVDDVISTGRTMRAAMDALISYGRPKSIKTAVLIDRGHREYPITADYVGIEIPTSVSEMIRVRLEEVDGGKDRAEITTR